MSGWITRWNPEDADFWEGDGRRIARRNLLWSIVAENLGFSVWMIWSVVATRLPAAGFPYRSEQLFVLVALPGLVGALMRFPYTFAVPRFGGRNWTVASALLLTVPTVLLALLVNRPATPFWMMAFAASTAGLGGGNFASSMANISFFYPEREKGFALGLNAAGGNIGVSNVQLLVPLVLAGSGATLARAGWMWLPLILLAAVGAAVFMDNLTVARSPLREQLAVVGRRHTWIMAWLYVGTFGSFVGFSAAFPLLLKTMLPEVGAGFAFAGALVGSLARPVGGRLADRVGGTRVTLWNFVVMAGAAMAVVLAVRVHSATVFLAAFLALFVSTGIGNGSTFRMIPAIFRAEALGRRPPTETLEHALLRGRRDAAAAVGITSAIGALGGYLVPRAFGAAIGATGSIAPALLAFVVFYATCFLTTWWTYARTDVAADEPGVVVAGEAG
jgi:NNP family nitrate/nitrite transporter-like MFS transporter